MGNGVVANQSGSSVTLNDGKLEYEKSGVGSLEPGVKYNTLTTPRGRQFQLVLPDGSKVWLNAASSITYPTVFAANERKVKIIGEVYFEVFKDQSKTFVVDVDGKQTVEVLGTHFNINSYTDEDAIRTTLLEGKVKVSATGSRLPTIDSRLLSPGQQASLQHDQLTTSNNVDLDQTMAWKNGTFSFRDADLPAVMRQLARWYNVDVEYRGAIPKDRFDGDIGNTLTLDQVLKGLAKTRIHYQIEQGNKLIILP
jgi:transmembrane sensor